MLVTGTPDSSNEAGLGVASKRQRAEAPGDDPVLQSVPAVDLASDSSLVEAPRVSRRHHHRAFTGFLLPPR
jgi:hypothetical protein